VKAGLILMNIIKRYIKEKLKKEKQKELNRKFAEIMQANRSIMLGYKRKNYDFGGIK
jgi:hypothetical protein